MKVIDLLNKIANGEEIKAKLKFKLGDIIITYYGTNNYYKTPEYNIEYIDKGCTTHDFNLGMIIKHLNDEIEILEEEKKIPLKINKIIPSQNYVISDSKNNSVDERLEIIRKRLYANELYMLDIANTLNEIIDYLKSKGDK